MEHVAILKEPFLSRILSGEKTIESRWYRTRRAPYGRISSGEMVWLKRSGGPVVAKARVSHVEEHSDLTPERIMRIVEKDAKGLGVMEEKGRFFEGVRNKRHAVLIHLSDIQTVEPFAIDKTGFGNQAAWMVLPRVIRK